jgi:structural maintenance of chromosome 3 (chondroitin sulfate proteoglycan 6)
VEDADVAEAEAALELIHDQLTTATSSLKQLQKELTALQKQLTTATSTLTSASSREAAAIAAAAALERGAVTESGARATWARRRAAVLDHLRALGPVTPVPASTRASLSGASLERRVAEAAVGVGALGGVNRQCGAQLACAEEELRGLRARADELSQGRVAIESLVRELDARKEEAVDRSVKTVAAHFSRAVEELLPGARATLVLHTSGDQQDHDQQQQPDDDDDEKQKKSRSSSKSSKTSKSKKTISSSSSSPGIPGTVSGVGSLTGVGMQVSFAGQAHAAGRLSGGQKTMLALALVVALQRADPSPVYLLDEVDANLDSGHRTAVAALVKGMGEEAQVVCTTFRGELLGACEKAYMVRFEDRESKVEAVGMREARAFMQGGAR